MKKILIVFIFLFGSVFFLRNFVPPVFANPRCITFKVKVTAKNWPGGKLQIGCPGDRGPQCIGEIKNIRVGQANPVVLDRCSCFPKDNGCVVLGKKLEFVAQPNGKKKVIVDKPIPAKCEYVSKKKFCGTNGDVLKANFKLTCERKPTPTPTRGPSSTPRPTRRPTPTPTPRPSVTPSPTPTPTPPICAAPKKVTNVKVTCPNCFSDQSTDTITIQGSHVDEDGAPFTIEGQKITIKNISTDEEQSTEASPNWSFKDLPRAKYEITASEISGYSISSNPCAGCTFHPNYGGPITQTEDFVINNKLKYVDVSYQYIKE